MNVVKRSFCGVRMMINVVSKIFAIRYLKISIKMHVKCKPEDGILHVVDGL